MKNSEDIFDKTANFLKSFSKGSPFRYFCITFALVIGAGLLIVKVFPVSPIPTNSTSLNSNMFLTNAISFNSVVYLFAIAVTLSTFVLMFFGGFKENGRMNLEEMRHIFAASLLIGFIILTLGAIINIELQNNTVVAAYIQMVGIIIGFYFGNKSAVQSQKSIGQSQKTINGTDFKNEGLKIENITEIDKDLFEITIRNYGNDIHQLKYLISEDNKASIHSFNKNEYIIPRMHINIKINNFYIKPGSKLAIVTTSNDEAKISHEYIVPASSLSNNQISEFK